MGLTFACVERGNRFPELRSRSGPRCKHAGCPAQTMQNHGQLSAKTILLIGRFHTIYEIR
jgi:hypothetical protein